MAAALIQAFVQLEDANGEPRGGARAYTYTVGTTTPLTTYSDIGLTTPHANPVVADSEGVFAPIYAPTTANVKVVLKTSADVTLRTIEEIPVTAAPQPGSIVEATLADNAVSNAKLANMAAETVKARSNSGTGDPEDIAFATIIQSLVDKIGATRGMLLYRGASAWAALAAGAAAGMGLITGGAGADPSWANNAIRAHCSFNGTGTPAFYGTPYNMASITDNATGSWTLNFTTALPSAFYTVSLACAVTGGNNATLAQLGTKLAASVSLTCSSWNSGSSTIFATDSAVIDVKCTGG